MDVLLALVLGAAIEWVVLMIVIPIAQRLADFSMPPRVETAWKLLVIVFLKNLVGYGVGIAIAPGLISSIAAGVVFWVGIVKVFQVDFFGAVIIVVVGWVVQWFIVGALVVALLA